MSRGSAKLDNMENVEPPVCVGDFEEIARRKLQPSTWSYISSGAMYGNTMLENSKAFSRFKIRPSYLVDVSERHLSTTVLGETINCPVGIAPTSLHKLVHYDGERATARAAAALGICYTQSTFSTSTVEEVSQASPGGLKWMAVYIFEDFQITKGLIRMAEEAGYKAIVLTVDNPGRPCNWSMLRQPVGIPETVSMTNLEKVLPCPYDKTNVFAGGKGFRPKEKLSWDVVDQLRDVTKLPIVLKGILTAEDASKALEKGVDAIWISNHGGRSLDDVPSTVEALTEIAPIVAGRCELYLDSGIRTGADIFKALALGARAVFIGRPVLWGLTCGGEEGVTAVMQILRKELDGVMSFAGCKSVHNIPRSKVVHEDYYNQICRNATTS